MTEINEVYTNCINTLAIINGMELKDRLTGKDHFFFCAEKQTVQPLIVTSQPSKIGEHVKPNTVQGNCLFNQRSVAKKFSNGEF